MGRGRSATSALRVRPEFVSGRRISGKLLPGDQRVLFLCLTVFPGPGFALITRSKKEKLWCLQNRDLLGNRLKT
jgi:hypothetical protein